MKKQCLNLSFFFVNSLFLLCSVSFCINLFMSNLRLGSLNINGARDYRKRAMLFDLIKKINIDVMFVQETHTDVQNENAWKMEWAGEVIMSHKTNISGGVAILLRKNIIPVSFEVENVVEGQLLKLRAEFEKCIVVFINMYAPVLGGERVSFLNKVRDAVENCKPEEYLFIGGDFNCTENDNIDRNHKEPHMESQCVLRQIIKEHDLYDIWRVLNKIQRQYTWTQVREYHVTMVRLDRWYCFKHHFNTIVLCNFTCTFF